MQVLTLLCLIVGAGSIPYFGKFHHPLHFITTPCLIILSKDIHPSPKMTPNSYIFRQKYGKTAHFPYLPTHPFYCDATLLGISLETQPLETQPPCLLATLWRVYDLRINLPPGTHKTQARSLYGYCHCPLNMIIFDVTMRENLNNTK